MRKFITFLTISLCIVGLLASCNNEVTNQNLGQAQDKTAKVMVTDAAAKDLIADGDSPSVVVDNLYWYYIALKTDGAFITGQKTELTPVKGENVPGLTGADLGSFSKGGWVFHFVGFADVYDPEDEQLPVYTDGGGTVVTVNSDTSLAITLYKGQGMPGTGIEADEILFLTSQFNVDAGFRMKVYDGDALIYDTVEFVEQQTEEEIRFVAFGFDFIELDVGAHLLTFEVYTPNISYSGPIVKVGEDELLLIVGQGVTYEISGFINVLGDETYGVVVDSYSLSEMAGTGSVEAGKKIVLPASPDTSEGHASATTVLFNSEIEGEEGVDYVLTATITTLAGSPDESTPGFVFNDDYSAVAALDLNLLGDGEKVDVEDTSIDVVTYIERGLGNNVKVKYNGVDIQGVAGCSYVYDSETGELSMHITHFSTFVVEFEGIAVKADGTAVADVPALLNLDDTVVKLTKNFVVDDIHITNTDLEIQFNGKMITPKKFTLGQDVRIFTDQDHLRFTTGERGYSEREFSGGVGNGLYPYLIASEFDLRYLAARVNAGFDTEDLCFRQVADIDLRYDTWTPIGEGGYRVVTPSHYFKGTYDGNEKTIRGLTNVDYDPDFDYKSGKEGKYSYGLFGCVENAVIRDLIIEDVLIFDDETHSGDSVGAFVGYAVGEELTLTNLRSVATLTGVPLVFGNDAVGGIIGRYYGSGSEATALISGCENYADVTAELKVGGIAGFLSPAATATSGSLTVSDCENFGDVFSTTTSWHGTESGHYLSMAAGILCFGQNPNKADSIIITGNTNYGMIRENIASYAAYIALAANFQNADNYDEFIFTENVNTTPMNYWFGNHEEFEGKDWIVDDPDETPVNWYQNPDYDLVRVSSYGDVASNADRQIGLYSYASDCEYMYSHFPGLDRWPGFVPAEHKGFYVDAEID